MPAVQRIALLAALSLALAGCKSSRPSAPPQAQVTGPAIEVVTLPEPLPLAIGQAHIETLKPLPATNASPAAIPPTAAPAVRSLANLGLGWVSLENWCAFNGLGQPQKIGASPAPSYAVATRLGTLRLAVGNQQARWDGVQCWLGFAPQLINGQPHVHSLDVEKTLQPLLAPARPPASRVVVIDAGHGGADGGTQGAKHELEKDFTLDWALRLQPLLAAKGWQVFLTRADDRDVPLIARVAYADGVGAGLFVSLHFNSLPNPAHSGLETYCLTPKGMASTLTRNYEDNPRLEFPNNAFDQENTQLAWRLHRELLGATQAVDGGVRRARFMGVLRGQARPAVLIEGGYLSNPQEARRIASPAYRQKLAEAVARALD